MRILAVLSLLSVPAFGAGISLGLPIECDLGENCFVMQYPDHDSSDDYADFSCGKASYDGHKGTDFRIRSIADIKDGYAVLAAEDGQIVGVRDGMEDKLARTQADFDAIANKECGNGVVIQHKGGWQTQYCHMQQGSVTVRKNQRVLKGEIIGLVGLSGKTQFPHVHMSLRRNRIDYDPFIAGRNSALCGPTGQNYWDDDLDAMLEYQPTQVLALGLSDRKLSHKDLMEGIDFEFAPEKNSGLLIAYLWMINLVEGDVMDLTLLGPNGIKVHKEYKPSAKKAQRMVWIGKRRPSDGWPSGEYTVEAKILRNGQVIEQHTEVRTTAY